DLPPPVEPAGVRLRLLAHQTGEILDLDLEEYLVGVVAAEMPASFHEEALKAQAVAARTYAARRLRQGGDAKAAQIDPRAQLSSDHQINQAWIDEAEMKRRWGTQYGQNAAKIQRAVDATRNVIMLYDGEIIDPLYHASCGGERTENAQSVWGGDPVPYLRSVACTGHQDRHSAQVLTYSLAQADQRLGTHLDELPAAAFTGAGMKDIVQIQERTETDRVKTVLAQGQSFSGSEFRSLLDLPSSNFQVQITSDGLECVSKGYGHGVGMCQYGAGDLAAQGKTYQEILSHYYNGAGFGIINK
ncbi:MAG: stage II sporulation protein D, partial [Peptococcaceae bacterium]|nr:stage II sporulation protein D [Peptococcaceae bacterium]